MTGGKIQAMIVDDEQHGREYVALLLKNEFPDIEVSSMVSSVQDAQDKFALVRPDILFLDIQLTDGSAFDLLSKINNVSAQLIFITAYENYALQAIKNDATDYILKPVERDDFVAAVKKAIKRMQESKQAVPKINVLTVHGFKSVAISDIVRCEADSNYTVMYFADGSKVTISKILQDYEQQLSGYRFFRIHHKHLINLAHFKEYVRGRGGQVIMSDGSELDVSIRKKNEFLERVKSERG